jgi:glycerophosphoryl diester phosphodiesterase
VRLAAAALLGCLAMGAGTSAVGGTGRGDAPLVIAHRGASGHRPEHTLEAYTLAIEEGADFVEPDLVATRDGVLVARHENEIGGTTDVGARPEFASRRTTKTVDGAQVTGWFTEDFTLAEIKTLRARERLPQLRGTGYDGRFEVPTLQEVIELVAAMNQRLRLQGRRRVGLYPETKHPSYFDGIGLSLEEPLVQALHAAGLRRPEDPVFIQSFEVGNLKALSRLTRLRLVQLLDERGAPYDLARSGDPRTYVDLATPAGLREIAGYAHGIGPHKGLVVPRDAQGDLLPPTRLVRDAHRAGLVVHAWTFRAENTFLPRSHRIGAGPGEVGDLLGEVGAFLRAGLDGIFTDHPGIGRAARDRHRGRR